MSKKPYEILRSRGINNVPVRKKRKYASAKNGR
jgi:hypothetical protein